MALCLFTFEDLELICLHLLQLEEVYLLEGLGPTPEANHTGLTHQSFVELVRLLLWHFFAAVSLLEKAQSWDWQPAITLCLLLILSVS